MQKNCRCDEMRQDERRKNMTLEQKAAFLNGAGQWNTHGYPGLGIPAITFADGPSGIRRQAGSGDHLGIHPSLPATCYPSAVTLANSWDEDLLCEVGDALGEECREKDVQVLLGPGLNIKRNPLCGRNFEYFSEDPYLSGKLAAAEIRGIQQNGVSSCPKHFVVNSQETRRMAMNAMVDERTLREIYLTGFEIAVREGSPRTLMSSYNRVNGTYANENPHLLQEILRGEWGYRGVVVTDWGGSNDPVEAVKAGSTLEMPYSGYDSARRNESSESEGIDRTHLRIPENQIRLLEELQRVNPHIVCILSAGSVVEMPWESGCEAILWTGLGGEAGAGELGIPRRNLRGVSLF